MLCLDNPVIGQHRVWGMQSPIPPIPQIPQSSIPQTYNSTQNLLRPTHLHLNNTNHISIHV